MSAGRPVGRVFLGEEPGPVLVGHGRGAQLKPLSEGYLRRVPRFARPMARRPALSLSFRREPPSAMLDGHELPLTLRRTELLTVPVAAARRAARQAE